MLQVGSFLYSHSLIVPWEGMGCEIVQGNNAFCIGVPNYFQKVSLERVSLNCRVIHMKLSLSCDLLQGVSVRDLFHSAA